MSLELTGLGVSHGIVIAQAIVIPVNGMPLPRYRLTHARLQTEQQRLTDALQAATRELQHLQQNVDDAVSTDLLSVLETHILLLQDETLRQAVHELIQQQSLNAEWALQEYLEHMARQFDAMEDLYLSERKLDLQQVIHRVIHHLSDAPSAWEQLISHAATSAVNGKPQVLVAQDLSPADMLRFRKSHFVGFVTDVGGAGSHTAIIARSMNIPAVLGTRVGSQKIRTGDEVIVDGDMGRVWVRPTPVQLQLYRQKCQLQQQARQQLERIRNLPTRTLDGQEVELLANIEEPEDVTAALSSGAIGIGLYRSEFLFMGRQGRWPDEEEQYQAYRRAVEGMHGLPVVIRTLDAGADKPLQEGVSRTHLNPALGLRAVRWSLQQPNMFLTQLRAILRAANRGQLSLMIPMLTHLDEVHQCLHWIEEAKKQLDARGQAWGKLEIGAMIEVPAAALMVEQFLPYFDFLSIGTNDLTQYTLAVDRADETVAHLFDERHPAVLQLVRQVIRACNKAGKKVTVCGEMAADPVMTRKLLGMGLRHFSMDASRLLEVKHEILQTDLSRLQASAQ